MATTFGSLSERIELSAPSRPMPERLNPPNGIASIRKSEVELIKTAPTRSRSAISRAWSMSEVKTPAAQSCRYPGGRRGFGLVGSGMVRHQDRDGIAEVPIQRGHR